MTTYNQLRATSYHLNLNSLEPFTYYALRYPTAWHKPLIELFRSSKEREPDKSRQVPIGALNDAIALLTPDLIRPGVFYADWNGEDWLYATSPIQTDGIARIVRAWIHTLGKQQDHTAEDHRLLRDALAAVQPGAPGWDDFAWERREIDFAGEATKIGANGTARPGNLLFTLLPHVMVAELTAPGVSWPHGQTGAIEFRRSATGDTVDAVSWLPANQDLPFSYKVTLQAQTVPGRPDPVVYANFGVRRWAYARAKLPATSDTSVYLIRSNPLLDKTGRSRAFRRIGVRWRPNRGTDWTDRLHAVLDHLALRPDLPDPADLASNPRAHLDKSTTKDGIAIVFRNELGKHAVEPGLSVRERRELFEWISHTLEPWIQPDEPFTRAFGPRAFATSPRTVKKSLERAQSQRKRQIRDAAKDAGTDPTPALDAMPPKFAPLVQAGLAKLVGDGTLTIEVHHFQDSTLPQLVATAISRDLGPATAVPTGRTWSVGTGRLRMTTHTIRGDHADKVDIPKYAKPSAVQTALLNRAADIERTLPAAPGPLTASIVEVNHRDYFKDRPIGDVKPVFRLAHANTGRITQFTYPPTGEKADHDRITRVWLDLLRQLGVQLVPPQVKIRNISLPERIYYLAIWIVRVNKTRRRSVGRRVPVMVYLDSTGDQRPQLISPYFDDWMDYHAGLARLARDGRFDTEARTPENKDFVHKFITDRIRDVTALRRDTLLLTDTGNLRPDWPFIGNAKLAFDHLDDQAVAGTGLRHVRVRDNCNNLEIPDVWGIGPDEKNDWGLSGGLWHMHGDRTFASTADKPVQAGSTLHGLSKVESYTHTPRPKDGEQPEDIEFPPTPTAEVWNARMVEMTVAAVQPGDDPRAWAGIAHQLRWANTQYDDGTTLPMPLHLASLAEEYVLGTQGEQRPTNEDG